MENIETKEIRYRKALKEVYLIINSLAEELYFKIPKSFIDLVKENMDKKYCITLEELNKNGESKEAQAILALIYRDYLCDEKTKKKLIEEEKQEILEVYQKYNNMFKNNQEEKETDCRQLTVIEHEKWYLKLLNKIKKFLFKR